MKFTAAFMLFAVLSANSLVSAMSTVEYSDLELRDEFSDGELFDILAREFLDYSDEFDEVDARDVYDDLDFLDGRSQGAFDMRLSKKGSAAGTGAEILNNVAQKYMKQTRPLPRIQRPTTFKTLAQKVIDQNRLERRPNAGEVSRQNKISLQNLQQKVNNMRN